MRFLEESSELIERMSELEPINTRQLRREYRTSKRILEYVFQSEITLIVDIHLLDLMLYRSVQIKSVVYPEILKDLAYFGIIASV